MGFLANLIQRPLVGLDIGVSGIKAVEISNGKTPRLMAYNRIPLPWNTISADGEIRDRPTVVAALKKLFDSKQFSGKKVAVGAAGKSVMTKKLSFPKMSREELGHQLFFEAEQYIPFDVADVNLDFAVLGPSLQTQGNNPMVDVLLVVAKKDYVSQLTTVVQEAGLAPDIVDIQAFALGNAFEFNYGYSKGNTGFSVIIDFGAGSTKVSVVEGDKTTFTRELRQCGIDCTTLVAERLGVSPEQAEAMKVNDGGSPAVKAILSEYIGNLVEEISRTLDYCASQSPNLSVQGIYICGGASRTEGLMPAMEARLGNQIQALNPIQNIAGSGRKMNAQAIRELSYLGAVAIGLSLRRSGDSA